MRWALGSDLSAAGFVRLLAIAALWTLLGSVQDSRSPQPGPRLLGFRSLTVLSGSMEPHPHRGCGVWHADSARASASRET